MKENLHPSTQTMLEKLTPEQCEKILNTKYTASDIKSQMERLEEIKEQLCKPGEVTVDGWIAVDEAYCGEAYLHTEKPHSESVEFCDTGDYEIAWRSKGKSYLLDRDLFPDMTPESEPKRVKITITTKL